MTSSLPPTAHDRVRPDAADRSRRNRSVDKGPDLPVERRGRGAARLPALALLLAALALVACGLVPTDRDASPSTTATATGTVGTVEVDGRGLASPTTTTATAHARREPDAAPSPLARQLREDLRASQLPVPSEPPDVGAWRPLNTGPDGPVAFNPCHTIHWRLHRGPGPAAAQALAEQAVGRLAEATGLSFAYDGPTDQVPSRASFPSANTSIDLDQALTPVVIGWASRNDTDLWASEGADTLGVGGPHTVVFTNGQKLIVSGFALLLPSDALAPTFGPGMTVGNVLLHELGHLVGLDHVDDPGELMQPRLDRTTPSGWGPGDRRGLWALGARRGCASSFLHPTG